MSVTRRSGRRPRVLLVGPFPLDRDRPGGGVEAVTSNLLRGLAALDGPDLAVVAPGPGLDREYTSELPEGPVTYVPVGPGIRGWWRDLHGRLLPHVRDQAADLVHVQGLASIAARVPDALLTVHGSAERDAFWTHRGPTRYLRAGVLVATEGWPRRWARRIIVTTITPAPSLVRRRRIWHLPNPIHPAFYRPGPARRGDPGNYLYLGRITPLKNVAGLIRAFGPVAAGGAAQLVIAGDGIDSDYGRHCRELVERLGLARAVDFAGGQSVPAGAELLRAAGTLVLFSRQERSPMVVAEALASGTAVVGSAVGEVPALLHGLPGCQLVAPGDASSLTAALLASREPEPAGAAQCRHDRARLFHPEVVAARTLAVYIELFNGGVPAGAARGIA